MRVAVVGGGLGGMAAAITLASNGIEVHLYEKNDVLGGKMKGYQLGSYHFDFGPNTIRMPRAFQQVLNESGVDADTYLSFIPLESHLQNVSSDGQTLYFSSNKAQMKEQIRQFSEKDAEQYDLFIQEIVRLYELAETHFLNRTFFDVKEYRSFKLWSTIIRLQPSETLEKFIRRYFSHPFVVQCFLRYGTYIGSSPYKMPVAYALSAFLELVEGVYYVKGGTSAIAKAFERRLKELNVSIHLNSEITDLYKYKHVVHTLEVNGEMDETFDATFVNVDVLYHKKMLAYQTVDTKQPTTSAIVVLLGLNKRISNFKHRNVYFTDSYHDELEALFSDRYADNATVYISNSSFTDSTISPDGDNLMILINAPTITTTNALSEKEAYQYVMRELFKKGIDLEPYIVEKEVFTPHSIQKQFAAYRGALYGSASNTFKATFFRPRNRHPFYRNLFFVGGTVHPGGGSPLVVLGGYNVAKRFVEEYKKTTL